MRILLTLLFAASQAQAEDFKAVKVEHFSMDVWKIEHRHDPYQPELTESWTAGGGFNFNLQFLEIFDWKNKLNIHGAQQKVMNAGWEFDFSLNISDQIKPFWYHHSEHSADRVGSTPMYPLEDRFGIRFCGIGCD